MTSLIPLRDHLLAALRASWDRWTVYDHDVPDRVPTDAAGKAQPYAVLYLSPTWHDRTSESLCADPGVESIDWQITVAAGHPSMVLRAVEQADAAMLGFTLPGNAGPVRRETAVPMRADRDVVPARWWTPLQYTADLG